MRTRAILLIAALTGLVSACAPKTVPLPPPGVARFPDFVEPAAPTDLESGVASRQNTRAWRFLQAGDLREADREAAAVLKLQPSFYPAQTTLAYIALARNDQKGAASQFARVIDGHAEYVPALVGRGLALQAMDDNGGAVDAYRAALRVNPDLPDVARRIDVLTLRGLQDELSRARAAAKDGDAALAIRAYRNAITASPDSAFLYRELAVVERQDGQVPAAIEHLTRAHELDPGDAGTLVLIGDLLDQQGDSTGALKAYNDALMLDGDPATDAKRAAVEARLALAALPDQYRAIQDAPQTTRADLAALIGVRLSALLESAPVRDIGVLTDIRGHWAERWMAPVARAGIIEALPNHTFQPRAAVRRIELAQAVARLLALVARDQPSRAAAWADARPRFTDLTPSHIAYPAAAMAVTAGVLSTTESGAFEPTRVVTGSQAIEAIERLSRIATAGSDGALRPR
ncbi:MAG: S-layer homology domain-containing protein [Vicinamibacterales bacterium]